MKGCSGENEMTTLDKIDYELRDLPIFGFCSCGNPVYQQLIPDLHDCTGKLKCIFCIKGLDWRGQEVEVQK